MDEGQIPLQQTKLWQSLQQELGETTFFLTENSLDINQPDSNNLTSKSTPKNSKTTSQDNINYQMLIIKKSTILGPYLYLPYGPYIAKKDSAETAYKALWRLAKQEHAIFTRIEPQNAETAAYWLKTTKSRHGSTAKKTKDLSPKETWVLDLTQSQEEIYHGMKQNTRNLAKNFTKKGVSVKKVPKTPENIQILYDFLKTIAKNNHFSPIERKTLEKETSQPFASLFIAYFEKKPIAASLFFDGPETRYYMQSGTNPEYKNLPATIAILDAAIKDAKAKNLKTFDFWGIAPENASKTHPWAGFTKFKKSFGGKEIHYAGTYDLVMRPLKYRLYYLLRAINRFRRKVLN